MKKLEPSPGGIVPQDKGSRTRADAKSSPSGRAGQSGQSGKTGKAGYGVGLLNGLLLALAAVSVFLLAFWFNIGSIRDKTVLWLRLDQAQFILLENERLALDQEAARLADQEKALADAERVLLASQKAVALKESELDARLENLAEREDRLSGLEKNIEDLVKIYEGMDPAKAAAILRIYEDKAELAVIVSHISQNKLSLILEQLNPEEATAILALLPVRPSS